MSSRHKVASTQSHFLRARKFDLIRARQDGNHNLCAPYLAARVRLSKLRHGKRSILQSDRTHNFRSIKMKYKTVALNLVSICKFKICIFEFSDYR